jgi:pyruvate/2-oxoglutarate dehydrogenase complex dihydrolipoamide dehydrogenase (E3) component
VHRRLASDGVTFHLGVKPTEVRQQGGTLAVRYEQSTGINDVTGDRLLVAAGRAPNVDGLGLDAAGVASSQDGIVVDDRLRTSNRRIYAAGDVCSRFKFTHAADALARVAIHNALLLGRRRASSLVIPWCTYTDPEVAHVGAHEREARQRGRHVETITIPLSDVDRAIVDDEADGFVRVHHDRGRLLGSTIVAPHAGDLIAEPTSALTHGHTLADLSRTIHAYPTQSQSFRIACDAYQRSRLTPRVRTWLERYFRWTR